MKPVYRLQAGLALDTRSPLKRRSNLCQHFEKFKGPIYIEVHRSYSITTLKRLSTTVTMAITPLVLPSTSSAESPALVIVHPAAIATILDQHIRRPKDQDGNEQDRVLGTLMGSRNEVR